MDRRTHGPFGRVGSVLLLALVALTACTTNVHRPYQNLALSRGLEHDGFVVGVEVRKRPEVGVTFRGADPVRLVPPAPGACDPQAQARLREFHRVMGDDEILFVSHCFEMRGMGCGTHLSRTIYNAYDPGRHPGDSDGVFEDTALSYEAGYAALDRLAVRLEAVVRETGATDVLLLCMGWHNDQIECLGRYNLMLRELKAAAAACPGRRFRPVVVGLTWPSAWLESSPLKVVNRVGHIGSYFHKARDADELGFGIANYLLHGVVLPLKQRPGLGHLRVALIGHSMGARALSRALYSRQHLRARTSARADLFVGLQPAMDAYRFVRGQGREGAPYAYASDPGAQVVLTTSDHDLANRAALWGRHLGGKSGRLAAARHPEVFEIVPWPPRGGEPSSVAPGTRSKILLVDATRIVRGADHGVHPTRVRPHNDVLDREMAELLWHYLRR